MSELDALIPYLQIFGIGFSFGLCGPCLWNYMIIIASIAPVYRFKKGLRYIFSFLTGRFCAYLLLGFVVGESAKLLKAFLSSSLVVCFKIIGAVIIIFLGLWVIFVKDKNFLCRKMNIDSLNVGNFFLLGILIGILPCAPLLALLIEISIISKDGIEGAFYMFFFGAGIFLSSLIILSALNTILSSIFRKVISSNKIKLGFRIMCGVLLILLGIKIISQRGYISEIESLNVYR